MPVPDLKPCPFCGSKMVWIDTSKWFDAPCFMCGARCSNNHCEARITFDGRNFSRSQFANKFNKRVEKTTAQSDIFDFMEQQ